MTLPTKTAKQSTPFTNEKERELSAFTGGSAVSPDVEIPGDVFDGMKLVVKDACYQTG